MKVFKLAAGLAVGYVLGSRAGREKYEQIAGVARTAWTHPTATKAQENAKALLSSGIDTLKPATEATPDAPKVEVSAPKPTPVVPAPSAKPTPVVPAPSAKPTPVVPAPSAAPSKPVADAPKPGVTSAKPDAGASRASTGAPKPTVVPPKPSAPKANTGTSESGTTTPAADTDSVLETPGLVPAANPVKPGRRQP